MPRPRTAAIDQRGDTFRVRITVAGKRHTFTVPTKSRRAAQLFAAAKLAELEREHERTALGLPSAQRFSEVLKTIEAEEFSTLTPGGRRSYQDSLGPIRTYFVEQLQDPPVDKIVAKHITGYLSWRRVHPLRGTEPLSNRTLQKDRSILHRIFAFAEEMELREGNPVRRVKSPKVDTRDPVILTEDQYDALLAACAEQPMLRLYVLCLGELGARCNSEVLWLRWEHIDLEEGFVWIGQERRAGQGRVRHRTKSGKGRWVPMTARLRDGMKAHFAAYRFGGSPWIFHHDRTRRTHLAGERIRRLRSAFLNAVERAELADGSRLPEGLHQHDLRHRRVTTWLAEGKNPVHVKEAMGHSTLAVTMGYTHLSREHLRSLTTAPDPAPAPAAARAAKRAGGRRRGAPGPIQDQNPG